MMELDKITNTISLINHVAQGIVEIDKANSSKSLDLIKGFSKTHQYEFEKLPYHINLIDELHANENAHSRILVKLLHYKFNNEYPILRNFLEYLSKDSEDFSFIHKIKNPKISAEKHRIDALIVEEKEYAVIIENKIHGAVDQPKQIKRYISEVANYKIAEEDIYILYLTRNGSAPSEDSFPTEIKNRFKSRFKQISFRTDILNWLNQEEVHLSNLNEDYLKSSIHQYKDHLEGMFHLRKTEIHMKEELSKHLVKELNLSDNQDKNIKTITETIENIEQMRVYLEELRLINYFSLWAKQIQQYFPVNKKIEVYKENINSYPKVGIELNYMDSVLKVLIEKENNLLYIGVAAESKEERKDSIKESLKDVLVGFELENKWYGWKETNFNNVFKDFKILAESVIKIVNS